MTKLNIDVNIVRMNIATETDRLPGSIEFKEQRTIEPPDQKYVRRTRVHGRLIPISFQSAGLEYHYQRFAYSRVGVAGLHQDAEPARHEKVSDMRLLVEGRNIPISSYYVIMFDKNRLDRLTTFFNERCLVISPFALDRGLQPEVFVVQNYPIPMLRETLDIDRDGHPKDCFKIYYAKRKFFLEENTLDRVTVTLGLDKMMAEKRAALETVGKSNREMEGLEALQGLPYEPCLTLEQRVFLGDWRANWPNEYNSGRESRLHFKGNLIRWLSMFFPDSPDLMSKIESRVDIASSLALLPEGLKDRFRKVEVPYNASRIIRFVLGHLPECIYYLPEVVNDYDKPQAEAIYKYFQGLGQLPDFRQRKSFDKILEVAFMAKMEEIAKRQWYQEKGRGVNLKLAYDPNYIDQVKKEGLRIIHL